MESNNTPTPLPEQKPVVERRPHLYLAVLAGGGRSWEANMASRHNLVELCKRERVSLTISINAGTGVDRARNVEVAKMRICNGDPTHILFLDNDIIFDPQWVIDMIFSGLPIVGSAYPRKNIEWENIVKAVKNGIPVEKLPLYESSFILNGFSGEGIVCEFGDEKRKATFGKVSEIGTGFMMIRRDVLEDYITTYAEDIAYVTDYDPRDQIHHTVFECMRDPDCEIEIASKQLRMAAKAEDVEALKTAADRYKKATENLSSVGRYLTEDYSFCKRAAQIGFETYCYMEAATQHIGSYCYSASISEGMKTQLKKPAAEMEEKVELSL